jgi:F-type H+-transporting ATPase subunit delta
MSTYQTDDIVSRVYSKAVFEIAKERNIIDTVRDELEEITTCFNSEKDYENFILSPYFVFEQKKNLMLKAFGPAVSDLTMNFLLIVIGHNRFKLWHQMVSEYQQRWNEIRGFCAVKVTVAAQLGDGEFQRLYEDIKAALRTEVKLNVITDPSIIGGVIIRYRDNVIDNTVRNRLKRAAAMISGRQTRWTGTDEI